MIRPGRATLASVEKREIRPIPIALGMVLFFCFYQMGEFRSFHSTAGIALDFVSPWEFRFWLAHAALVVPGALLVAWGLTPMLADRLARLWRAGVSATPRSWAIVYCGYFALLLLFAVLGREMFLLGLPITDDEQGVHFGAQIIASGRLSVPVLEPADAYRLIYTTSHEGMVFSMEFPGTLLIGALAILTGLGSLLYALLAAGTGCLVMASVGTVAGGRRGAMVAGLVWLCSPMARLLAMTTHTHVVSQFFIALAILMYLRMVVGKDCSWKTAAILGCAGGAAFLTRSAESAFLLLPIVLHLLVSGWREPELRYRLALSTALALLWLAFYAWYNMQTVGSALPGRFNEGSEGTLASDDFNFAARVGGHMVHNWVILLVMLLGPAGAFFMSFAYADRRAWLVVLGSSAVALLCLSLFHSDVGIHEVGPIHLSDLVPIGVILASVGMIRFVGWIGKTGLRAADTAVGLVAYLVVALGFFICIQGASLRKQAEVQSITLDVVEAVVETPAIVVAPPASTVRRTRPEFAAAGSWVYEYPHPDPDLSGPVIFVREGTNLEVLFERFPKRYFYGIKFDTGELPVIIYPIR